MRVLLILESIGQFTCPTTQHTGRRPLRYSLLTIVFACLLDVGLFHEPPIIVPYAAYT